MPAFRACPICNKTGIIKDKQNKTVYCPVCSPSARRTYNVPPMLESGWTTAGAIENYLRNQARDAVAIKIADLLALYKASNPGASNSQIKKYTRSLNNNQLIIEFMKELKAKYHLKDDE